MERRRVKSLMEQAFDHFGKDVLYEEQLFKFYMDKGMSRDEVKKLVVSAIGKKIIMIGSKPIARDDNPMEILGNVTVFRLLRRDEY